MQRHRGIALVVTLLGALALFVVVIAIVTSLSLSNRRLSGSKAVELEAQYAAESGAGQGLALLGNLKDLLQSIRVDLSRGGSAAAYRFAARLYTFCHGGDPDTLPHSRVLDLYKALRGERASYSCQVAKDDLLDDLRTKTPEELGNSWLRLLVDYIPAPVYSSKGITNPARFWGQVMNGSSTVMGRVLRREGNRVVRYRISTSGSYGLLPQRLEIQNGHVTLYFGDPDNKNLALYSVGEVLSDGVVVAQRRVQLGSELSSLLAIDIEAPSFAWFALFFDHQPSHNPARMIAFTDDTVIDGPVHTNDYFAFEQNATPWFGGPISSAGPNRYSRQPGFYWRHPSRTYINGFEAMPSTTDPTHWWNFNQAAPDLAIQTDPLGRPLCYNPETGQEEVCSSSIVDKNGDKKPDAPWEYVRAVNWAHDVVPMPGRGALRHMRELAEDGGIYFPEDRFCDLTWVRTKPDDPKPTLCVGKYTRDIRIQLRAENGKQIIRIEGVTVKDWVVHQRFPPHWNRHYYCWGHGGGKRW